MERRRWDRCIPNVLFAPWESSQKMNSFVCFNAHGSRLSCSLLSSGTEVKGGIADRCNTASLDEARKLLWWKKKEILATALVQLLQGEADMASFPAK